MKDIIKQHVKGAKFKGDLLVSPLPRIQVNYRIVTNVEMVNIHMSRFRPKTVIEAIKNNKIILVSK